MKIIFVLLISLVLLANISSKVDKDKVVFAVNCGGDEYIDKNGIVYQAVIN